MDSSADDDDAAIGPSSSTGQRADHVTGDRPETWLWNYRRQPRLTWRWLVGSPSMRHHRIILAADRSHNPLSDSPQNQPGRQWTAYRPSRKMVGAERGLVRCLAFHEWTRPEAKPGPVMADGASNRAMAASMPIYSSMSRLVCHPSALGSKPSP